MMINLDETRQERQGYSSPPAHAALLDCPSRTANPSPTKRRISRPRNIEPIAAVDQQVYSGGMTLGCAFSAERSSPHWGVGGWRGEDKWKNSYLDGYCNPRS